MLSSPRFMPMPSLGSLAAPQQQQQPFFTYNNNKTTTATMMMSPRESRIMSTAPYTTLISPRMTTSSPLLAVSNVSPPLFFFPPRVDDTTTTTTTTSIPTTLAPLTSPLAISPSQRRGSSSAGDSLPTSLNLCDLNLLVHPTNTPQQASVKKEHSNRGGVTTPTTLSPLSISAESPPTSSPLTTPFSPSLLSMMLFTSPPAATTTATTTAMMMEMGMKTSENNRFHLQQEPLGIQRKSYKTERRFILPNPLVITTTRAEPQIHTRSSTVTVTLCTPNGQEYGPEMQAELIGDKKKAIEKDLRASFSLMIRVISADSQFRLKFRITYRLLESEGDDEKEFQETILSAPFRVESNVNKKMVVDVPRVISVKPAYGPAAGSNEAGDTVWIWGSKFIDSNAMVVKFGDFGNITPVLRSESNVLECHIPPCKTPITTDTPVIVHVGIVTFQRTVAWSSEPVIFTYKV